MTRKPVVPVIGASCTTFGPKVLRDRRDVDQIELAVRAAVTGDRSAVLLAMLLDPVAAQRPGRGARAGQDAGGSCGISPAVCVPDPGLS